MKNRKFPNCGPIKDSANIRWTSISTEEFLDSHLKNSDRPLINDEHIPNKKTFCDGVKAKINRLNRTLSKTGREVLPIMRRAQRMAQRNHGSVKIWARPY